MGIPADIRTWEQVSTYDELLALMARQDFRLLGEPGAIINYSNEGFVLLGAIVERASGRSFAEYLQAHVLDPLGMARTGLYTRHTPADAPEVIPYAVDTRSGTREVFPSPAWWDQGQMFGNGGLKSTTRDLLRYLEIYRTGGTSGGVRVLSEAGIRRMTTPHQPIPTGGGYGYGLRSVTIAGLGRSIEHGGGNKGVATHVAVLPEHGLTVVALTNLANAPAAKLAYGLANAAVGRAPDAPLAEHPQHALSPERLRRYAGVYLGQPGTTVTFAERGGTLYVTAGDAEPQPARPYADDAFLVPATEETYRFLEDAHGEVWAAFSGMRTLRRGEG
jgi:CubicO group peptidase (beta-lactamase class C family)